jgi:hypothetical protein
VSDIGSWSIATRFDEIAKGDDVALWVSGPSRGVYAVGKVTGLPTVDASDEYWVDAVDRAKRRRFLPIRLTIDLTAAPISGEELKADPRFANTSVITFPRGANPHHLDATEWQAIADRL